MKDSPCWVKTWTSLKGLYAFALVIFCGNWYSSYNCPDNNFFHQIWNTFRSKNICLFWLTCSWSQLSSRHFCLKKLSFSLKKKYIVILSENVIIWVNNDNFITQKKQRLLTIEITIGGQTLNFNDLLDEVPDLGFKKKMKVKDWF